MIESKKIKISFSSCVNDYEVYDTAKIKDYLVMSIIITFKYYDIKILKN